VRTALACFALLLAAAPATAGVASFTACAGVGVGVEQPTTASWWSAAYIHPNPVLGAGVEAGVDGWDTTRDDGRYEDAFGIPDVPLGPDQLRHVAGALELRMPGLDAGSGPYARLVIGAYQQSPHTHDRYESPVPGVVRPGGAVAFGASGRRGLAPGAEFRVQWVSTTGGPLTTFTAAFGLDLDVGRARRARRGELLAAAR